MFFNKTKIGGKIHCGREIILIPWVSIIHAWIKNKSRLNHRQEHVSFKPLNLEKVPEKYLEKLRLFL